MHNTFGLSSKSIEKQIPRKHYWFWPAGATVLFAGYQSFFENLAWSPSTVSYEGPEAPSKSTDPARHIYY